MTNNPTKERANNKSSGNKIKTSFCPMKTTISLWCRIQQRHQNVITRPRDWGCQPATRTMTFLAFSRDAGREQGNVVKTIHLRWFRRLTPPFPATHDGQSLWSNSHAGHMVFTGPPATSSNLVTSPIIAYQ